MVEVLLPSGLCWAYSEYSLWFMGGMAMIVRDPRKHTAY